MEKKGLHQLVHKIFSEEKEKQTFAKVFDYHTVRSVHALASKGFFDRLEFVISTGKEAHVFRAIDQSGSFRAVKIYKTDTSDFKNMQQYISGDKRFAKIKKEKFSLVKAWTQKEYKNLERASRAGASVPLPITFKENVLVMEFIGKNGKPAPPLKKKPAQNPNAFFENVLDNLARLYAAGLVHADISEYNILNHNEKPVLIDMGQGVLTSHPRAQALFERDLQNIVHYFKGCGVHTDMDAARAGIRLKAGKTTKKRA